VGGAGVGGAGVGQGSGGGRAADGRAAGAWAVMAEQCTGRGAHGVVAAAAPQAATAGLDALARGGNAYDAAVAAALAETVLLPPKCGLGGDLVALVVEPGAAQPEALLAIGGAAGGLADAVAAAGGLPETGPLSVGVPSAPAGYAALARRGRSRPEALAAESIRLARHGFCWSSICTVLARESAELVATHSGTSRYYPGGVPIEAGTVVTLPGLADALERWASDPEGFLQGEVGQAVVERVADAGGVLDADDLERYATARWLPCPSIPAGSATVWATPAPTHGPALLEAARGLVGGAGPAQVYRRVLEAVAWRRDRLADPSGTSMVTAVDGEGRVVVVVHSNSFPRFGSGLVVDRFDLILNNRAGRGFTDQVGHPNAPVAGRRPATTLHAWAVGDASSVHLVGATPGGANQMPWNAQLLAEVLGGQDDPGVLVTAPRWEWVPTDDGIVVEDGFGPIERAELAEAAPRVADAPRWALRSAQQVALVPRHGEPRVAAADPRTVGAALGR
jgi:gamma-glutamyltranspeptidase / glutathione hydrolase